MTFGLVKISQVRLNTFLSPFPSKGHLLNADECYLWIRNRKRLIGWTYNFNIHCPLIKCFTRLISCQGQPSSTVRIANNTHIKCYIDKKSMLITSFNLTYPTVLDLGIVVSDIVLNNYMRR